MHVVVAEFIFLLIGENDFVHNTSKELNFRKQQSSIGLGYDEMSESNCDIGSLNTKKTDLFEHIRLLL